MRVVVSGGGTGGHIFPALAVCEALRRLDAEGELLYIGATTGMETGIVPDQGVPFQAVTAEKLRKLVSVSTVGVALSLFKGFREARAYLKAFKAQAVVGAGGYVAAAAALAGVSLGLPTVILAPDMIPGRTNLMLARFAKRICIVFEESASRFPAGKTVVTGLPLRSGVTAPAGLSAGMARCQFPGLAPDRFTVVIIGGSQGARAVNNVILEAAPKLLAAGVQVLHQTGPRNWEQVRQQAADAGLPIGNGYVPIAFLDAGQVAAAYRAADIIVCRGGVSTLSEVTANGLPSIVIPLPTAYADHQTANAKALARHGAAIWQPEKDLSAGALAGQLENLQHSPDSLRTMASASLAMGQPDAADKVARLILDL